MTDVGPDPRRLPPVLPVEEAAALARRHGMQLVGRRPSLGAYVRDLWRHRHLMWSMARGEFVSAHRDNYLGLLWAVLNPIMLAAAYYLIFGVLVPTRAGIENFVAFLTIGLFTFTPLAVSLTSGTRSLLSKVSMMRSLTFPRVMLPITVVLAELLATVPAFIVLVLIALVSRERPSVEWLLFPVALMVVGLVGLGTAMIGAPLIHAVRDAANLMPVLTRLLRYVSGVFFSLEYALTERLAAAPGWLAWVLEYQPVAVCLTLVRETLMGEYAVRWETWAVAGGWAVGLTSVGFLLFWRGEGTYGRA
ncbi:ABC transporter permease [Ornithinimicrobium sp. W1679]|uniref:ABC transporter permease n=1 Tax=unclassified Ornithinimicrobium TaxID=2615080 RepID=UPI003CF9C52B